LYSFLISPTRSTCFAHRILTDLITLIIFTLCIRLFKCVRNKGFSTLHKQAAHLVPALRTSKYSESTLDS
jgi:hypothetical protein